MKNEEWPEAHFHASGVRHRRMGSQLSHADRQHGGIVNLPFAQYGGLLGAYLKPQRSRVALLAALLLGGIGLQLINPQILRFFIDTAQSPATAAGAQPAVLAGVAFIAVGLLQRAMMFTTVYLSEHVGWAATNGLRADLARHCLRLDMSFHKQRTPGELIERIDGDVTTLGNFFSQFAIQLLGNAVLIVAVLVLLFREDWRVGLVLSGYTLAALLALRAVQNVGVRRWGAYRAASAEQFGFLEERMSGTEDIRASGAEAHILRRFSVIMQDVMRKNRAARLVSNLTFATTHFLAVIGYGLGLAIGAYLYSRGAASIGTAFLIVSYIGMLSAPLDGIREQIQDLQQAAASISRIGELFAIRPLVLDGERASLPAGALAVEFDGASFRYDDHRPPTTDHRPLHSGSFVATSANDRQTTDNGQQTTDDLVLEDISFQLEPGRVLGLLGRTGGGKTTLTRLLFRLYDPCGGAIRLGGVDIRDLSFADLRARVGMVTQEVQLFQASIRDNLALFDRRIDDRQIAQALDEVGLWGWAQSLPAGLDTRLGAGGLGLSAGEAQLLAFARVFLRDPGLIILDEASSRLDPATERLLERAIDRLLAGRTAIIIAHRLDTVRRSDTILILDGGEVAEYGPRERLAGDTGSRFYHLLQTGLEEVLA
jgi:ATP-binding cassette, subfamily B, bacterial